MHNNKIVETSVEGFKGDDTDRIVYSLKGFSGSFKEYDIFESLEKCFEYLTKNVKTPETLSDKAKTGIGFAKNMFAKKG